MDCIVTQGSWGVQQGATIRPTTLRHDLTIQLAGAATRQAYAQGQAARARAAWPWGESQYNSLYSGWGRPLVSRYGAARLRYNTATRCAVGIKSRYDICIGTRGRRQQRCNTAACAATLPGTTTIWRQCAPRHGSVCPATRRSARGQGAVQARPVRSLGHGCVHCSLDPVLTQCTVLSHCLDNCSRVFQKKKKLKFYKIK